MTPQSTMIVLMSASVSAAAIWLWMERYRPKQAHDLSPWFLWYIWHGMVTTLLSGPLVFNSATPENGMAGIFWPFTLLWRLARFATGV